MSISLLIQYFIKGGWIMWPILATSLTAFSVIIERIIWWKTEKGKRDDERLIKVYAAMEKGDLKVASGLARTSQDPILRVIWHGLNHYHSSLEGALQVAAAIELKRAGRFLVVMDTIVTLAPLLGLIGTVTGLMRSFFSLGSAEISAEALTGGIAEALIATACGLSIAVVCLIALNVCSAAVAEFQFELQNACTNTEVLLKTAKSQAESTPTATVIEHETNLAATA
jgi:biopolymer transport protein ExbB